MTLISVTLPIRTVSEANVKEHWGRTARRVSRQRRDMFMGLYNYRDRLRGQWAWTVTLTRIAPRFLDEHDNLPRSMKACVDEVAKALGVDDKSKRVHWAYSQEKGKPKEYAVRVRVEIEEVRNGF